MLASAACLLALAAPALGAKLSAGTPGGLKPLLSEVRADLANSGVGHHHRRARPEPAAEQVEESAGSNLEQMLDASLNTELVLPEGVAHVDKGDVLIRRDDYLRGQDVINAPAGTAAHHKSRHHRRRGIDPKAMLGDLAGGAIGQGLASAAGVSGLPPPMPAYKYERGHEWDHKVPGDSETKAEDGELISTHCYANCGQCFRHKTVGYIGVVCCDMCGNEQGVLQDKYHPWNQHLLAANVPWDRQYCLQVPQAIYSRGDNDGKELEDWLCPNLLQYYHPNSQQQMAHEGYSAADPAVAHMLSSVDLDPFQNSVNEEAEKIGESQAAAAAAPPSL